MDIDVRRNLIIGALDPRHDDVDQASCPGIGTLGSKNREPGLPLGLLRHLVRRSGEPRAGRRLRRPARGPHGQLHRRLQLRLDGRAGAPRRPGLPRAVHARRPRRRPADLGHRSPQPDASEGVPRADRPLAQRRADRLLARRRRRRRTASPGRAAAAACWATRPRAGGAIRGPTTMRNARPWDPILVAGGGIEGGPDGVAQPQTDFIHNAARPLDGEISAAGVPDGNVVAHDRGGLHRPVQRERPHRRRGHHRLARRRARDQLDAGAAVPDERAERVPPDPGRRRRRPRRAGSCSAHYFEVSGSTVAAGVVRPGAAPDRRVERPQPAPGGLLLRDGHRSGHEPELAVVGRRLARRPDLPVRHEPRRRDPATRGRARRRPRACRRCSEPARQRRSARRACRCPGSRPARSSARCSWCPARADADRSGVAGVSATRPASSRSWTCAGARCRFASWSTPRDRDRSTRT